VANGICGDAILLTEAAAVSFSANIEIPAGLVASPIIGLTVAPVPEVKAVTCFNKTALRGNPVITASLVAAHSVSDMETVYRPFPKC
tara:strand:- start:224 stop:484 length:261 start_codon:yes stop_codon:yes gene_type:complete